MEEDFEISIEIPMRSPLKRAKKETLMQILVQEFKNNGASRIDTNEPYYVERRSAELSQTFVLGLQVSAHILSMIASVLVISRFLGKENKESHVFVRKKDGKYVKITDDMVEEEVRQSLQDEDGKDTE